MILPDVSYVELKNFVADIYCHHPHFGWSHLDIPQPRKLVTEDDDDCDYTVHWGAGPPGPAPPRGRINNRRGRPEKGC